MFKECSLLLLCFEMNLIMTLKPAKTVKRAGCDLVIVQKRGFLNKSHLTKVKSYRVQVPEAHHHHTCRTINAVRKRLRKPSNTFRQ